MGFQTMASWCTEPNQRAMISPIIRSGDQAVFRGDVSMTHCMQSTCPWSSARAHPCSRLDVTGLDPLCGRSRASNLASTTGRRCFIKVVAARCPPVAIRATRLISTSILNYAAPINLRHQTSWRNSKHFRSKDHRLREFQCGDIEFVVLSWHRQSFRAPGEKETNLHRSAPKKIRQLARVMTRLAIGKTRTRDESDP